MRADCRLPRPLLTPLALAAALLLAGCHRAPPAELVPGNYRGVLTLPGGELPFGLTIATPPTGGAPIVYLLNGGEAVHVTEFSHAGSRLVMLMPGYGNRLELDTDPKGYHGEAVILRRGAKEVRLPLRVVHDERFRFQASGPKMSSTVGGRWAISVRGADGHERPAIGEFKQLGWRVFGTILDPSGDHRYLEGDVTQDEVLLSAFDGGLPYLYRLRINADGTMSGHWWTGSWGVAELSLHRDDAATLTDPALAAAPAQAAFSFSFPDLDARPVALTDPRFRGKVVIVTLGGTWCPNCHDEAAFLVPLYRDLKDQGLEIVSLQFEHYPDAAAAVAVNRRFVAKFAIPWPVLIAGLSDRDEATRKLPGLGRVYAFPTTVLVGRDGRIAKVHSGFNGPATGQHYLDFQKDFTQTVRALLAAKP
jgi:peroxiredoxin